ncbi:MAG: MazG nucleotide pyrophosphohydrolase domain-containing protein [Actinomycetota bacterium]|nr:MazG nucleotide pyrophosphohydrolase domain-containing protein [Actinomycetota bacterium]
MRIKEPQEIIARTYRNKDATRGEIGTFVWMVEEVGELSRALRRGDQDSLEEEFADVMAWLFSLASLRGVDAE